ncbi:MAG: response regulator transcription factor [Acidobacteria bacterium]|nr:response regulator transcription factor [Acidobacteriota bacterium]
MKSGTVFACESQPIVVEGLQRVLGTTSDLQFAGAATDSADLPRRIGELRPDVVLLDLSHGLRGALQLIAGLREASPTTQPVLWVHELAENEALRSLQFGVRGVVRKALPVSCLVDCLRAVVAGQVWIENGLADPALGLLSRRNGLRLTPREREIVQLVCLGRKNREIAEALDITAGTVKVHLMHVFEKTGVKDRFELALHGRRMLAPPAELAPEAPGAESVAPEAEPVASGLAELAGLMAR